MSDKMREEFESWWVSQPHRKQPVRFHDGDYVSPSVHSAWGAWQASRASLVVELPEAAKGFKWMDNYQDGVCQGQSEMRISAIYAIHAAGVSTK
jgi:hypothetical protein